MLAHPRLDIGGHRMVAEHGRKRIAGQEVEQDDEHHAGDQRGGDRVAGAAQQPATHVTDRGAGQRPGVRAIARATARRATAR